MVKSRITLQKALGTVVWHRAGGFALVQALLPDRLFIINGIVIANRVFGGNIGGRETPPHGPDGRRQKVPTHM